MHCPTLKSNDRERGFALIITIVLVAFLVLILVGLATFTRVETQVAGNSQDMAKARQNALMALNIAIGELQVAAGPDSRVTAPAEATPATSVLGGGLPAAPGGAYNAANWTNYENNLINYWGNGGAWRSPQWVGVWRNVVAPPNEAPRLVNWLVSGNEQVWDPTAPPAGTHTSPNFLPNHTVTGLEVTREAAVLNPTVNARPAVVLVGNRSTAGQPNPTTVDAADLDRYVVAPKINITGPLPDGTTGVIGRYAWWVGDQGVKAALNAAYLQPVNTSPVLTAWQDQINGMQSPGRLGLEGIWGTKFTSIPDWLKVLHLSQASFAPAVPSAIQPEVVRSRFHDLAGQSYGLLIDTLNSGFKTDLTTTPAALPPELSGVNIANYFPSTITATIPTDGVLRVVDKTHPDLNAWDMPGPTQLPAPFQDRNINATIAPVVADARLTLQFNYVSGTLQIRMGTELLLWNPYTSDFSWTPTPIGAQLFRNGYRYRVQWLYDTIDNGGFPWDGRVSVGYIYKDAGLAFISGGVVTVPLNLFGADTHLPSRATYSVRDILTDAPGNHVAGTINHSFARLRAGETALFQQIPSDPAFLMARTNVGLGYSVNAVMDQVVAFPNPPPALATEIEARLILNYVAAASRNIRLAVYARQVDESSVDMPNTGAPGDGPIGSKETLIFNQLFALPLGTAPVAAADLGDWDARWKNGNVATKPGVFSGVQNLVDPVSFATPTGTTEFYSTFHARNVANSDTTFWDNYANPDPRDVGARSFAVLLEEGSATATTLPLSWAGLTNTTSAQLPRSPTVGIMGRDQFPMYFEAAREQPVSVVQLGAAPNFGGSSSSWLGLAPTEVPVGSVRTNITTLNQTVLDGFYFSTVRTSLLSADIATERLRNKRYELAPIKGRTPAQNLTYLTAVAGRPPAAALRVVAPFNINSVSQDAWAVQLKTGGQPMTGVVWENASDEFYARTDTVGSNVGRFRQAPGLSYSFRIREQSSQVPFGESSIYRNGQRELAPLDLYQRQTLAPASRPALAVNDQITSDVPRDFARIVRQANLVRVGNGGLNAGPVFSIAEFANNGALETAIANVPWTLGGGATRNGLNWQRTTNAGAWVDFSNLRGTPSFLSQRDLLQALVPILSARSDTFVIRTYGEAVNPASPTEVVGKIWCEAIVVRSADYVDDGAAAGQKPEDSFAILNATNQNFGRRFRIIAFRWLGPDDI